MVLQIGRGNDEYQRVVVVGYLAQVAAEDYFPGVEMYAGKIAGVVAHATEVLYLVFAAHIPANVMRVLQHNLGNGRRPRATTDDGYTATKSANALLRGGMLGYFLR